MSTSLNRATIIGNTTKDIELKSTQSGQNVCSFSVATNRSWKGSDGEKKEQVEYHNIVAWGKLAKICAEYIKKGTKVYVDGRLQTREYETDSGKKSRTEIVAENVIILTKNESKGTYEEPNDEISMSDIPF